MMSSMILAIGFEIVATKEQGRIVKCVHVSPKHKTERDPFRRSGVEEISRLEHASGRPKTPLPRRTEVALVRIFRTVAHTGH